jgi:hypothetical protein
VDEGADEEGEGEEEAGGKRRRKKKSKRRRGGQSVVQKGPVQVAVLDPQQRTAVSGQWWAIKHDFPFATAPLL